MQFQKLAPSSLLRRAGLLALPLFDGRPSGAAFRDADAALDGLLSRVAREEGFTRSAGKTLLIHTAGRIRADRVLLVGLGARGAAFEPPARVFAAIAAREALARRSSRLLLAWPHADNAGGETIVEELALGAGLGSYRFDRHKSTSDDAPTSLDGVEIALTPREHRRLATPVFAAAAARGQARAEGVTLARDLVNEPANHMRPQDMRACAERLAAAHDTLQLETLGRAEMEARGMGLLLAVGQGAASEPQLIHLTYRPAARQDRPLRRVAIVGKGVTFDAGGLDIKGPASMRDMKCDMGGGAAVLGAMATVAALGPDVEVHGIVPAVENMLGADAYRPGDVIRGMNGTTVEVGNTDAEGRLALADAIAWAVEMGIDEVIDLATLTGACVVGLGEWTAGLFSNRRALARGLLRAADRAGESLLELPLDPRMKKDIESPIADLANVGGRYGGACHGGLFLERFAGDCPWAHLDIAGPAYVSRAQGITPKGATGYGVLTLTAYLCG